MTSVENERIFSKINKIQNKFTNPLTPKKLFTNEFYYILKKLKFKILISS